MQKTAIQEKITWISTQIDTKAHFISLLIFTK